MNEFQILNVLKEVDPMGLIRIGAPDDEYLPEVPDLFAICREREIKGEDVLKVFEDKFWPSCISIDNAQLISEKLGVLAQYLVRH